MSKCSGLPALRLFKQPRDLAANLSCGAKPNERATAPQKLAYLIPGPQVIERFSAVERASIFFIGSLRCPLRFVYNAATLQEP